jgi:hypothetical protein
VHRPLTTSIPEELAITAEPGSFRDPGGRICWFGDRVLRTVMPSAAADFEYVESTGLIEQLVRKGMLIGQTRASPTLLGDAGRGARYVLEHPRLEFISYPYEWPFAALQAAALLQLDLYI